MVVKEREYEESNGMLKWRRFIYKIPMLALR